MGNIFPRWTNLLAVKIAVCVGALGTCVIALAWYSWTPKHTRVGYMPQQPIPFDHSLHAGQLGMDCRYCHSFVENSPHSNIPAAQVCWKELSGGGTKARKRSCVSWLTFPDDRRFVAAVGKVAVDTVVAEVDGAVLKPLGIRCLPVKNCLKWFVPVEVFFSLVTPEPFGVIDGLLPHGFILLDGIDGGIFTEVTGRVKESFFFEN